MDRKDLHRKICYGYGYSETNAVLDNYEKRIQDLQAGLSQAYSDLNDTIKRHLEYENELVLEIQALQEKLKDGNTKN